MNFSRLRVWLALLWRLLSCLWGRFFAYFCVFDFWPHFRYNWKITNVCVSNGKFCKFIKPLLKWSQLWAWHERKLFDISPKKKVIFHLLLSLRKWDVIFLTFDISTPQQQRLTKKYTRSLAINLVSFFIIIIFQHAGKLSLVLILIYNIGLDNHQSICLCIASCHSRANDFSLLPLFRCCCDKWLSLSALLAEMEFNWIRHPSSCAEWNSNWIACWRHSRRSRCSAASALCRAKSAILYTYRDHPPCSISS